ncbi:hypothetical protein [Pedobacter gandavensis]|uniref:hypothetical protein n=1 Tax=Pedobacter gandavensis TaxID=2679963 RepID=UPI0029314478|nr:hypothetical protein [Pedobacter gandavensis]
MEPAHIFSNLKSSRALISDYVTLDNKRWQHQFEIQNYNRKGVFNLLAVAVTLFMMWILTTGSGPKTEWTAITVVAPLSFVVIRFLIGDVLDYFKRKRLKRDIQPELLRLSEKMNNLVAELDSFTVLPEKYRTLQAVGAIGNYFVNKRIDTLKEGFNLYEDELFKFQQLKNQQFQINQNTRMMHQNNEMIKAQRVTNSLLRW